MSSTAALNWVEANQRCLMAALTELRQYLEKRLSGEVPAGQPADSELAQEMAELREAMTAPPALESLCGIFNLTGFERNIILTCAGVELDASFANLFSTGLIANRPAGPNFSFMLAHLPEAHWSALSPTGQLRYRRLVELSSGDNLTLSPLRLDERVLHYLTGLSTLDERLMGLISPLTANVELVASYQQLAQQIARLWSKPRQGQLPPVVQLSGHDRMSRRDIGVAACSLLGLNVYLMTTDSIPTDTREQDGLIRLLDREAALSGSALLLDCGNDPADPIREGFISEFIENLGSPLLVSSRRNRMVLRRPSVQLEVQRPTYSEQMDLWRSCLGESAVNLNGQVESLASQFNLNPSNIRAIASDALERSASIESGQTRLPDFLWQSCCSQSRTRLESLAQHINPVATWNDLVLPPTQIQTLREITAQVKHRQKVYQDWGFSSKSSRGLGISVLFSGSSGTGKTMAAEVLANELRLSLYRIDLSQVVSKYIGETEKNLGQVFDAAEDSGAILLFDEADALFGHRSEVKDSHDRYANIEVSYLLQRMESFGGLAILTTNLKSSLDSAFLRRLRFTVQFPFPDVKQRAEIWRRIFPETTPTKGLDTEALARLNVSGGNIHNMAMTAAFLAAEGQGPVTMQHLLSAARSEYNKLEKTLTDSEVRGWV